MVDRAPGRRWDAHELRGQARDVSLMETVGSPLLLERGKGAGMVIISGSRARSSALIAGPDYGSGSSFNP